MKVKKATKKGTQPATKLEAPGGPAAASRDLPAKDLKADPVSPASTPTLVDVSHPTAKKTKKKAAAKSEKPAREPKAGIAAKEEKKPLNFKVSSDFRREFKTYASAHDLKLSKLLELAFESYRKQQGD